MFDSQQVSSCFLDASSDHGIIRLELRYLERVGEPTKFKIDLDFRDNPTPGAKRRWEILRGESIDREFCVGKTMP